MTKVVALPKNHPEIAVTVKFQLGIIIFFPPAIFSASLDNSSVFKSSDPDYAITPPESHFWGVISEH